MNFAKEEIEELIKEKVKQGEEKYGKSFKLYVTELITLVEALNDSANIPQSSRIIPLSQWGKYHDYPTVPALRQYYFNKDNNGFVKAVAHGGNNGGRILLDEAKLFEWLRSKSNNTKKKSN